MKPAFSQPKNFNSALVPWLMIVLRLAIALAMFLSALDRSIGPLFFPALVLALALDVADGMLARRLSVASLALRRADSFVDIVLFYAVVMTAWLCFGDLLRPFLRLIALAMLLQLATAVVALIKYRALPPYHTWSSRIAGIILFLAAAQLFVLHQASALLAIALLLFCLSCLESIAITLTLPAVTADVPGLRHALRLRSQQASRPIL